MSCSEQNCYYWVESHILFFCLSLHWQKKSFYKIRWEENCFKPFRWQVSNTHNINCLKIWRSFVLQSWNCPQCIHTYLYIYIYIYIYIYTGCPRRNVPDIGRVFLRSNYTDITQNTYVQSWTVAEIMAREVWKFDSCYSIIDYQIHIETGRNMWFL